MTILMPLNPSLTLLNGRRVGSSANATVINHENKEEPVKY